MCLSIDRLRVFRFFFFYAWLTLSLSLSFASFSSFLCAPGSKYLTDKIKDERALTMLSHPRARKPCGSSPLFCRYTAIYRYTQLGFIYIYRKAYNHTLEGGIIIRLSGLVSGALFCCARCIIYYSVTNFPDESCQCGNTDDIIYNIKLYQN